MEASSRNKLIALGSVAAAAAVVLVVVRRRHAHHAGSLPERPAIARPGAAPVRSSGSSAGSSTKKKEIVPVVLPDTDSDTRVTWDTLLAWATSLRKKDTAELPLLLAWTQRVLSERPSDKALSPCLVGLQNLVGPGHELADLIAKVAILASSRELEKSLELLNVLYKDRRHRTTSTEEVVALALATLRGSISGSVSRGANQRNSRLVNFLTEDPDSRALLIKRGGAKVVVEAMQHFEADPGILVEMCSCLRSLASEPSLDIGRAVGALITCLRGHLNNGDLQWRSLAALHGLPHWDGGDAAMGVAELAVAAGTRHPRHDTVVEWIAKVLYRLAKNKTSGVQTWLRTSPQKAWLSKFREESYHIRKPNKEAEHWVAELHGICRK